MNPRVAKAYPEPGYRVCLEFSNGERREFDVSPYLDKGVFRRLRDEVYFRQVRVSMGTIEWPEGQDFCPDTLYECSKVIA
ncbi:MAG: DUF2442 domain-containing protein [Verrucomicrobiales bacterium]